MAKMEASRFAVLKVEDDYDSDDSNQPKTSKSNQSNKSAKQTTSQNAKKKNKAKKQSSESKQVEVNGKNAKKPTELTDSKQWEEWAKKDAQYCDQEYEKELQEALIKSKLQHEQMKQDQIAAGKSQNGSSASGKKKKNKKDKPVPMSLEEFSQTDLDKKTNASDTEDGDLSNSLRPMAAFPQGDGDPDFFNRVDDDVKHLVKREQMQKEFQKQYEFENAQTTKLQKDLTLRDKEIVMLKATVKKLEDELQQVKKRNQQLCHILAQGEMKDKTDLLVELDDLKQVRDDLTDEVQRLTSELEKERSKVNTHTTNERAGKGGKHSNK